MDQSFKQINFPDQLQLLVLANSDLLDGSCMTVTGQTLAENVASAVDLEFTTQDVVRPLSNPIKTTGHLCILRGNLAPNSAVAKITGKEGTIFKGPAICFDTEAEFYPALKTGTIKAGMAIILRYLGPKVRENFPGFSSALC